MESFAGLDRAICNQMAEACLEARRHYAWYLKGVPYAGDWKERICHVETMADLERITAGIKRDLK